MGLVRLTLGFIITIRALTLYCQPPTSENLHRPLVHRPGRRSVLP